MCSHHVDTRHVIKRFNVQDGLQTNVYGFISMLAEMKQRNFVRTVMRDV
jgi:hypothetical protein